METLFRWSKHVDEDQLDEWETRLIVAEVVFSAEKMVNRKRWQISSFATSREHADELRARFGGGVTEVLPRDWQPKAEAEAGNLLRIRDTLVVTEAEDEAVWQSLHEKHPDRIVLSFPPQLAFGTGGHPTTAGCLRFLADAAKAREGSEWSLLDLGCGSGILAVAAAKLGATRVVAVENDNLALKYARQNAERHGVEERVEFISGDAIGLLEDGSLGEFDVVAANLFSELLIKLMPNFPRAIFEDGEIILSGFLTSQAREVTEASREAGVPLTDFLRRGKWVAGHGRGGNA